MAAKILNTIFYQDITNIIIQYIMIDKEKQKEHIDFNIFFIQSVFDVMLPNSVGTDLLKRLKMIKNVNKMLGRIEAFRCIATHREMREAIIH